MVIWSCLIVADETNHDNPHILGTFNETGRIIKLAFVKSKKRFIGCAYGRFSFENC